MPSARASTRARSDPCMAITHRRTNTTLFGLLSLVLLCCSCADIRFHTTALPAFHKAANETPWTGATKIFDGSSFDEGRFPSMAPYAIISVSGNVARHRLAAAAWPEAKKMRADVALLHDGAPQYVGSVGNYVGFGVSTSTPVYAQTATVVLYRVCPARTGFRTARDDVVAYCDPRTKCSESGLLEGDRVLSLNGTPFDVRGESTYWNAHLDLRPGDRVKIIWLREGVGRMEGLLECVDNPPSHLKLEGDFGSADWQ